MTLEDFIEAVDLAAQGEGLDYQVRCTKTEVTVTLYRPRTCRRVEVKFPWVDLLAAKTNVMLHTIKRMRSNLLWEKAS